MIRFGQYLPGASLIHDLDPRIKIGTVFVLSLGVLQGGFLSCAVISAFLIGALRTAKIPPKTFFSALRPGLVFLALLFFLHLLFTKGTPVPPFKDWFITITFEGFERGAFIAWQFAILLAGGAFLTMTTAPSRLVGGLEWFLRPLNIIGVRSHEIALMVSLALRFVPTLLEEMQRVKEAQIARGAVFGRGGPSRRIRAVSSLAVPVLMGSLRRADDLAVAMEARGYAGDRRTHIQELKITRKDCIAAAVIVLLMGVVLSGDRILGLL